MPSTEVLIWVANGGCGVILAFIALIWKLTREESKEKDRAIESKADSTNVKEIEIRLTTQLTSLKEDNEKLINKLETRYDKEMDTLATRVSTQIKDSEHNILSQMRLFMRQPTA